MAEGCASALCTATRSAPQISVVAMDRVENQVGSKHDVKNDEEVFNWDPRCQAGVFFSICVRVRSTALLAWWRGFMVACGHWQAVHASPVALEWSVVFFLSLIRNATHACKTENVEIDRVPICCCRAPCSVKESPIKRQSLPPS